VARRIGGSLLGLLVLVAATGVQAGELRGDANCDGHVDQSDVAAVLAALFGSGDSCAGVDVNADGRPAPPTSSRSCRFWPSRRPRRLPRPRCRHQRGVADETDTPKPPTVTPR
jgi:hypothetical protein